MLIDEKIKQTNTGGQKPENNAKTEKRIGIILNAFRAMLLTATGGTRYYDLLWGAGLRHSNDMINYAPTSDGKPSPFERRTGMPYDWEKSEAYVFGQGCTYWVKKEHRVSKWQSPGAEAIWVRDSLGKSKETPGADLVIPITWDGGSSRYVLAPTVEHYISL